MTGRAWDITAGPGCLGDRETFAWTKSGIRSNHPAQSLDVRAVKAESQQDDREAPTRASLLGDWCAVPDKRENTTRGKLRERLGESTSADRSAAQFSHSNPRPIVVPEVLRLSCL